MSGWIKFEKDLPDDPRVLKMARELDRRLRIFEVESASADGTFDPVTLQRYSRNACVTLAVGALARMWAYADTHIREDDILEVAPDELNELFGCPFFHEICPDDWLEVVDDEHVRLPNYLSHNGSEARKKAVTQKRVERHRTRNAVVNARVTHEALPDQDQDQDSKDRKQHPKPNGKSRSQATTKSPIPEDFGLTQERQAYAEKHLPQVDSIALMETFRSTSKAKGWKYVDWDQHWQTLVRQWGPNSGHWSSGQYPRKAIQAGDKPRDPTDPFAGRQWQ